MKKLDKPSIEDYKKFMDDEVQPYLRPLMIDVLKKKPTNVREYIIEWCQTKGLEIERNQGKIKAPIPGIVIENEYERIAKKSIYDSMKEITCEQSQLSNSNEEDHMAEHTEEQEKAYLERLSTLKKKAAISAEADVPLNDSTVFLAPVFEKSEEQLQKIRKTLALNFMFNALDEKEQEVIVHAMKIVVFTEGETVIYQGDDGNVIFVVGSGLYRCTQKQNDSDEITDLKMYKMGDVFGELAIMYNAPRAATITTIESGECYTLDRGTFNSIVKNAEIRKKKNYELFLQKIDILADLNIYERSKICDCLETEKYQKSDQIIKQGDEGNKFYLIQSGTANALMVDADGQEKCVFQYRENDYFGELALLNKEKRKATIEVTSDKMSVVSMDSDSFSRLLGPLKDILKRNAAKYEKYVQNA